MNNEKIVIVDDDRLVTTALKTMLEIEAPEYFQDAVFFNSPNEALEFLKTNSPAVIISDFLMPQMNGIEFLEQAKKIHPKTSLILLTGYADKENAIRAINDIGLYKYIEKPWDNDDLVLNIKNAMERSNLIYELEDNVQLLKIANSQLEKYAHGLEELVAQKTADIIQANSKLSAIISNCADGIIIVDASGLIQSINPACENLLGMCESIVLKKEINEIIISEKNQNILELLYNSKRDNSGEIFIRDCFVKNVVNDKNIPVEVSFAPIYNENGEAAEQFVGVVRNVSAQKEMERLRDDFIATLTHDLRTPLLATIQTLEFFVDGTLGNIEDRQKSLLSTMKSSNQDMLGLVNALLEVYKYESGKLYLNKSNFELNEFLSYCRNELLPLALKKNINFILETEQTNNVEIIADKNELRRVILNLCGNAITHTNRDAGEIKIITTVQGSDLILKVQDNGDGIPKKDICKIFKRFSQGTSDKRSVGTGLGLYLSRQIIEAHNGKIWLESDKNKGSEFSFLLPACLTGANLSVNCLRQEAIR